MKRICNWIHPFWDTILVICRRSFLFSCGFWVNARQRWLRWYRRTYSEGNPKSYSKRHGETMPIWRCDNAIIALLSCLEVWMIHFVHRMLSIHRRKEGRFYFLLFILSVPNIFSFSSSPELLPFFLSCAFIFRFSVFNDSLPDHKTSPIHGRSNRSSNETAFRNAPAYSFRFNPNGVISVLCTAYWGEMPSSSRSCFARTSL